MMHPAVLRGLAAEHVKDMIATADKSRRTQQARRARRWRTSVSGSATPASHPVQLRRTVSTRADSDRPDSVTHISAVDSEQLWNRPWPYTDTHRPARSPAEADPPGRSRPVPYNTREGAIQ
jgi:hypothetical protein